MVNSDLQLVHRMATGEREAFEAFLDLYGPRVHRLARRYASGETDAEDLTQEIFLDLYRSIGGFRGEATLATWVYRVAVNHCLRHRERLVREGKHVDSGSHGEIEGDSGEIADAGSDPARRAAQSELKSEVQGALGDLSPLHRDVVILHELHGLTYRECAVILDVPIGTVKSRLSHAFRHLRDRLGAYVCGDEMEERRIGAEGVCGEAL
jgi:RNA polymerase sigma-70 factor (ECF subfamily)